MEPLRDIRVAAILGPTAVGKSRLAVEVASRLQAEIVSVDSMQVYRGMDIGTAKPDAGMRRRVPHHLLDVADPGEEFSVALYQEMARRAVEDISSRGKLPLLVGGTGLYFEAVVFDLRFPPGKPDDELRRSLERQALEDPEALRQRLREVDPAFASSGDLRNLRRVIRALEVYERTGLPFSSFSTRRGEQRPFYPYVGVVLNAPRPALYRAIEERVDGMFAAGLVEEVKRLTERGALSATARQALGYKEVLRYLDNEWTLEETISQIKRRSRLYAKRQITWFRKVPGLRWFELGERDLTGDLPAAWEQVLDYLTGELGDA